MQRTKIIANGLEGDEKDMEVDVDSRPARE